MQTKVLVEARDVIITLRKVSGEKNLWWMTPLINFTEEFVVVLEWWHCQKKVTLYITEEGIEYIASGEGKDGRYKTKCGELKSDRELRNIWVWLANVDLATELKENSFAVSEEDAKLWREVILTEMQPGFPNF